MFGCPDLGRNRKTEWFNVGTSETFNRLSLHSLSLIFFPLLTLMLVKLRTFTLAKNKRGQEKEKKAKIVRVSGEKQIATEREEARKG